MRERFERLLAAGLAIFSEHHLAGVLQEVVDLARDVVGARYAALGVLAPDRGSLSQFVTSGMSPEERERIGDLPQGRGLLGVVIRDAVPLRSEDIGRHPRRYGFPPHHPPMKSFLGVPIAIHGQVFGNLYLTEKIGAAAFSEEDERLAVQLAAHAAVAVENARLHERSEALLEQVQAMQRQRDLFFAMMNHELRNALTGVYGWAERLVRAKDGAPVPAAAQEVYDAAERTIVLLNNFLDLTRLDAGKVRLVWRDVDVRKAIERACVGLRPQAEEKRIALEVHCGNGASSLRTDPVRLEQILVNLVSNALRHGPEESTVQVDVHGVAGGLEFRVRDAGPGVPEELRERIFEPFERFDPHSGVGTGLGLPVSRRLAEIMGGRLAVADGQGGGASFVLFLPHDPPMPE